MTNNIRIMRILSNFKTSQEALCDQSVFVSPFKDYYIQVEVNGPLEVEYTFTRKLYTVYDVIYFNKLKCFKLIDMDYRLIVICMLGLMLFFEAERISKLVYPNICY